MIKKQIHKKTAQQMNIIPLSDTMNRKIKKKRQSNKIFGVHNKATNKTSLTTFSRKNLSYRFKCYHCTVSSTVFPI